MKDVSTLEQAKKAQFSAASEPGLKEILNELCSRYLRAETLLKLRP